MENKLKHVGYMFSGDEKDLEKLLKGDPNCPLQPGDRIRKRNTTAGDRYQDGDMATIIGCHHGYSEKKKAMTCIYIARFDKEPPVQKAFILTTKGGINDNANVFAFLDEDYVEKI